MKQSEYRFEVFHRPSLRGPLIYVRFLAEDGAVLATRSTGETEDGPASAVILRLSRELDLAGIEAARVANETARVVDPGLADLPLPRFLEWFWGPSSDFLQDRTDAREPLSADYVADNLRYIRDYVAPWSEFDTLPLRRLSFAVIDRYFRAAKKFPRKRDPRRMISPGMIHHIRNLMGAALGWASARGLCREIDLSGLVLPQGMERKRDILSDAEISAILNLPIQGPWEDKAGKYHADVRKRPRMGRELGQELHHTGDPGIDIRMKAFVLLGPYCGLRRGEERGLRWQDVDLERGLIRVESNWIDSEGSKAPKAGSTGVIPIAPELEVVLWELREIAEALKLSKPSDFVLFNLADPEKPISESSCRRGWERIMRAIGITDAERRRRNLVPHGSRHRFATKLIDAGLLPAEAAKLTRHKTLSMLQHYADHISQETMAKGMEAIRGNIKD